MRPKRRALRNPGEYNKLLQKLTDLRSLAGFTQAEVAEALGISRSQYTLLESGACQFSCDHLISLAKLYSSGDLGKLTRID